MMRIVSPIWAWINRLPQAVVDGLIAAVLAYESGLVSPHPA